MHIVVYFPAYLKAKTFSYIRNSSSKVEPSVKVHPGVYVNVNDHYEVADPKSVIGSDEIRTLFEHSWGESLRRSAHIAYALLEKQ